MKIIDVTNRKTRKMFSQDAEHKRSVIIPVDTKEKALKKE